MKDFFVSFNRKDRAWAEWIAWILEAAGYSVVFQPWDFRPGSNFVLQMHEAAQDTSRTIAVLSRNYLGADFPQPEWAAAFAQDPKGQARKLIPFRIDDCDPPGLLGPTVYVDLHNLSEQDARIAILGAFSERAKPSSEPAFPGTTTTTPPPIYTPPPPAGGYPGEVHPSSAISKLRLDQIASATVGRKLSTADRLLLNGKLNSLAKQHFNMLVFALHPPDGLVPDMPAPQGERVSYLLGWAESGSGCGLATVVEVLNQLLLPQTSGGVSPPTIQATPTVIDTANPVEFVQRSSKRHPLWRILLAALTAFLLLGLFIAWRNSQITVDNISFPTFMHDFAIAISEGTLDRFSNDHLHKQVVWECVVSERTIGGYRITPIDPLYSDFKVLVKYDPNHPVESLPNKATVKIQAVIDEITPLGPILKRLKVIERP